MEHTEEEFRKRVEFKATDDERQVAKGVVMVPSKVDLQGDYVSEDTIRDFAEQFMSDLPAGDAEGGVMHAVWPDEHVTLVENRVTDANTTIGGESYPQGTWTQSWKFDDNELWTLLRDGILSGYSIGAKEVDWSEPVEQDELPDGVTVAEDYPDEERAKEIRDGTIREVSAVDIPAVPDAQILSLKDAEEKRVADLIGDKDQFVAEMLDRGHSEGDADRLWNYLRRAADEDVDLEDDDDDKAGLIERAGRAAVKAIAGSGSDDGANAAAAPEAPDAVTDGGADADKASRTLSEANVQRLKAAHDTVEDALSSEVDFRTNRFTDDPADTFDVADFGKSAATGEADEDDGAGGEADADTETTETNMSETDEMPEWARDLKEQTEANAERLEDLADDGGGEGSKEKTEGGDGDADGEGEEKTDGEPPEWAEDIKDLTETNAERIGALAKASGHSQQLTGDGGEEEEDVSKADFFGLPGGEA